MQEWSRADISSIEESGELQFLYLYTPLCGTCQVAGKMLTVVAELMPNLNWGKTNLNYIGDKAEVWSIESVPCLVVLKNGIPLEKIYAFHSVPFLLDKIKTISSGA